MLLGGIFLVWITGASQAQGQESSSEELSLEEFSRQELSLILSGETNGHFAPIYWARSEDLYQKAGIDLKIIAGKQPLDTIQIIAGQPNADSTTALGIVDLAVFLRSRSEGAGSVAIMHLHNQLADDSGWKQATGIPVIIVARQLPEQYDNVVRSFVQVTQQAYISCHTRPDPCVAAQARSTRGKTAELTEQWHEARLAMKTPGDYRRRGFGFLDPDLMRSAYQAMEAGGAGPFNVTDAYSNAYIDQTLRLP
jgi:ABC-type nitrate/sulfonate/bicarbonate transport system substrate-binding protein